MSKQRINLVPCERRTTIAPEIFGHFVEFLGRCINDGIWSGEDADIQHEGGLRLDIIEALRRIGAPAFRWPGGTFADCYHWKDGIGPRDQRPRTRNIFWGGIESNHFGTDEFLRWCRLIGAEPVIQTNLGSGSPQETLDWMEYCNGTSDCDPAQLRRKHGHEAPHGVKYWSIGNETGWQYSPEEYAHEVRRFGFYMKQAQPDARLIACGDNSPDWNSRLMAALGDRLEMVDLLSLHCYGHPGPASRNGPEDTYMLLAKSDNIDAALTRAIETVDGHTQGRKRIDIIVDEWGSWHHEVRVRPGFPVGDVPNDLQQPGTLRDALYAARVLHVLIRHADRVAMANLAQTVNTLHCLLKTQGASLVRTPTYHVFDMLKHHAGGHVMAVEGNTGAFEFEFDGNAGLLPKLDIAASMTPDGTRMTLSIVNPHIDREEILRLNVKSPSDHLPWQATATILGACEPFATNDFLTPDRITPQVAKVDGQANDWTLTCAPFSLTTVVFLPRS
jgi:alpha-N-arabinofuranosidase